MIAIQPTPTRVRRQVGAALITGLLFLVVVTLVGVTAMRSTNLEERMAYNMGQINAAFQATETGLRGAELWLEGLSTAPIDIGSGTVSDTQVYQLNHADALAMTSGNPQWWETNAKDYQDPSWPKPDGSWTKPRAIIEQIEFIKDSEDEGGGAPLGRMYYRITASGVAGTDTTQSIIQSTYARRY